MSTLVKTAGLVLHTTPYSESSVIARIFTRELGVRPYILKGVRGVRCRVKQNLLQPLSYLEMTVYNNPRASINYVKEVRPAAQFPTLASDCVRTSMLFFMNEVTFKSLREDERNEALFDYLVRTMQRLDIESPHASSPVNFLLQAAQHLGIAPRDNYSAHLPFFDLEEGCFIADISPNTLDSEQSLLLHRHLQNINGDAIEETNGDNGRLLDNLLRFFQMHLSEFHNFKSHEILHTVLN